jgi:hypothetical protein
VISGDAIRAELEKSQAWLEVMHKIGKKEAAFTHDIYLDVHSMQERARGAAV